VLFISSPGKSTATAMGALAGAGVGFALSRRYVPFSPAGPMWQRALRFAVGVAVVVPLYSALGMVPLAEGSWLYLAFRFLHFALLGVWATLGAPWLFRVLRLAGAPEESVT
jgi:hypothetical protein